MRVLLIVCTVVCVLTITVVGGEDTGTTVKPSSTSSPPAPGTTPSIGEICRGLNTSCDSCVSNPKCLFCSKPRKCVPYPVGQIIPHSDICDLGQARWGVCFLNYKVLLIAMGVVGGVILLSITCCCVYCCCCRGNNKAKRKYMADEQQWEEARDQRKARNDERRAERKTKLDEIRRKYGLMKDEQPYQRFDDA